MRVEQIKNHKFMLMEAGEIPSAATGNPKWMNYQIHTIQRGNFGHSSFSIDKFAQLATVGDENLVEQSERFLSDIEDQVPLSRGWRNVDDVVGAVPNVPAYLAGHPQCMRRRMRTDLETAPLAIYMNLSSGMGIKSDVILRRGVVLMALVRSLVEHRPVELWVGASLRNYGDDATVAWRIDTTPLDLARAAFHIADVSMSRVFGYAMCESMYNKHMGNHVDESEVREGLKRLAGWHDVFFVPWASYSDPMVNDPVAWLKHNLRKYTGAEVEE